MKIGIITDIHSNIQALNAVLEEFDKHKVDRIICCGDIIGIGINPEETMQELIKRKDNLISVKGNHEEAIRELLKDRLFCLVKMPAKKPEKHSSKVSSSVFVSFMNGMIRTFAIREVDSKAKYEGCEYYLSVYYIKIVWMYR